MDSQIVLGVDCALRTTGYGVIRVTGKRFEAVDCGVIRNTAALAHSECLRRLGGGIRELVEQYKPAVAAIEGGFYFRNAKTAAVLGMARGSVIVTLATHGIPVYEYAPARAKQMVVGHGRATKAEVAQVMAQMLKLDVSAIPDDATDAFAIAICHSLTAQTANGAYLKPPV